MRLGLSRVSRIDQFQLNHSLMRRLLLTLLMLVMLQLSATASANAFSTPEQTARFLNQATFGATEAEINALTGTSPLAWFGSQLSRPPSRYLPRVFNALAAPGAVDGSGQPTFQGRRAPNDVFWTLAISSKDQLRQRMAYALSQILVISNNSKEKLFDWPKAVAYYQDLLVEHAFGNYRDLLEAVTYSPAMATYLTYLQNTLGDAATGRLPDENYAREIMQLFTLGLVELQPDGRPKLVNGQPVETYSNSDVSGLARVFTGLSLDTNVFFFGFAEENSGAQHRPLRTFAEYHSPLAKRFLGTTIPAGTSAAASIDRALDALVAHPNTPPFIARQLIQRFVTSNPTPSYVRRVATAFRTGSYTLPDGQGVGEGRRGDLAASVAAILFDSEARSPVAARARSFGKVREPVLRFTHWARAFKASNLDAKAVQVLTNTSFPRALGQAPFQSPSVFNFYRPGYVAPGTQTGAIGLTVPELQLVNANTLFGYSNFMNNFIRGFAAEASNNGNGGSFKPDYRRQRALAGSPWALVKHLDLVLNHGSTSWLTKNRIVDFMKTFPVPAPSPADPNYDGRRLRVEFGIHMLMTSPDYVVLR